MIVVGNRPTQDHYLYFIAKIASCKVHSQKNSIVDPHLGCKYASALWRFFKRFISLTYLLYKTLEICYFVKVPYSFNSSKMVLRKYDTIAEHIVLRNFS